MSPITSLSKSGRRIGAFIKIPLGVWNANALLLKQSPDLVRTWLLMLWTPFWASWIQNRSSSSIAVSPKAMIRAFGAGTAKTARYTRPTPMTKDKVRIVKETQT